ncbi:DMT family transporter [Shewanella glacialimarina]|jgi:drug/metabolite transporter (DMT)-like permease|uniref:DMT family transporter n=1 Tax=Shewanella glacialimarina TaxID=2590884 RepID=UPI001CF83421|nr:EamA family transporter [Shewanella glacialimarina]UCX06153.1 EamA family transporter [Shewanella glacialimarina]
MNILLAMIPAFFWGTTYAMTQFTLPDWPPLLLGALRALPAGLILLAIKPSRPKKAQWPILIKLGAINIAVFFSLIFVMALTLPSAISGIGMISVPVFAMLFHWVISKKRPNPVQAFFGMILVLLAWMLFDPSSITLNPIGLVAMLAAISCIIVGSTITKALGTRIHWWTILTWQLIIGGALLLVSAGVQAFFLPQQYFDAISQFSLINAAGIGWIVLLNTVLGYSMYVWLLQRMSVVDFTFGGIANPIAGIVCGLVLMSESYTPHQYLLMGGMILASIAPAFIQLLRRRIPNKAVVD